MIDKDTSIIDIVQKYIPNMELIDKHYMKIMNFYDNIGIKFNTKFIKINSHIQIGGSNIKTFSARYRDNNYSFDYYKSVETLDDHIVIFINKINNKDLIKEYSVNNHCAMLSYSKHDQTQLQIYIIEYCNKCIKTDKEIETKYKPSGTILMKLIILFAKHYKFKSITLEDESKFYCKDSTVDNLRYELKYVYTMTKGIPYYAKFGFVFVDQEQNLIMESNKNKMTKLKLDHLGLDVFVYLILNELVKNSLYKIYKYDFIKGIHNIMNIYKQALEDNISLMSFLNHISYNECQIMCVIYHNLYRLFKLEYYTNNKMILHL